MHIPSQIGRPSGDSGTVNFGILAPITGAAILGVITYCALKALGCSTPLTVGLTIAVPVITISAFFVGSIVLVGCLAYHVICNKH